MNTIALLDAEQCQQVFRILLDALAHPGTVQHLPGAGDPMDLPLLALTDQTTAVAALDASDDELRRTEQVCALTHAPLVPVEQARFVVSHHDPNLAELGRLNTGTNEHPHEGALLIQAAMVAQQPQPDFSPWELSGPGIADRLQVQIAGLSADFFKARHRLVAEYPRGVDVLLIDPAGTVLGLPRTTRMIEVQR